MSGSSERSLSSAPGMLGLFARAGVAMIPGASRLPFVPGGGGAIPSMTLSMDGVTVERDRLAAYDRVCGFTISGFLPPTYPHMLAFPLHLALMTDGRFPFGAIGLVHITNSITVHRPVPASETVSLRVWPTQLEPHPRGQQFSIRSEARVGTELVWEEVSTNLRRTGSGGSGSGGGDKSAGATGESEPPPTAATWRLPGDLGRKYAAVSGDANPIHLHPLSARLFGFPSAIAHGMWTKARCLAALESRLPERYTVDVAFKRPILLPATVEFGEAHDETGIRFAVRGAKNRTPHLQGSLRFH